MLYAAYGSNLHPIRLTERVPSARVVACAEVFGLALRFVKRSQDGSSKCSIVPDDGGVHVGVFKLDPDEKHLLDKAEGLGYGYDETLLEIPGIGSCFTYSVSESHKIEGVPPYHWYKKLVILGAEFHGFPDSYVQVIRDTPSVADQEEKRRAENWKLIGLMQ